MSSSVRFVRGAAGNVAFGLAAATLLCTPLPAQNAYEIAVTDDAATVYLSTTLRQAGTDQPLAGKLFFHDSTGLHPAGSLLAPQYNPAISGDGRTIGIGRPGPPCTPQGPGLRSCYGVPAIVTNITRPGLNPLSVPGTIRLSQNGRYAVQVTRAALGDSSPVWDLRTGEPISRISLTEHSRFGRTIANDGTVVVANYGLGIVYPGRGSEFLQNTEDGLEPSLDSSASTVVFTRKSYTPGVFSSIGIVNLRSRTVRTLAQGFGDSWQPVISNDSSRVIFLSTATFDNAGSTGLPQVFVIQSNGSDLRQVTLDPAGVESAWLAGNGQTAIVLSRSGTLNRVDVESGQSTQLIGPALSVKRFPATTCSPGSLCLISGIGFSEKRAWAAGDPVPLEVDGFSVLVNKDPAPLLWVFPEEIAFQVPWNVVGRLSLEWKSTRKLAFEDGPLQFDPGYTLRFWPLPAPYDRSPTGNPMSLAVHEDFRSLALPENPARSGEVIHFYATGLGPVTPAVGDGVPAPADPFSIDRESLACSHFSVPIDVLYKGLAPGMVGVFQVSMRMPEFRPGMLGAYGVFGISCGNRYNWSFAQVSALASTK